MNLLKNINYPEDLRKLKKNQLQQLSEELREELIDVVSETGGHLGAGLGVIELTVALHYVFNTPNDKLVWDVSHQCYPHKILTGRKNEIRSLRKGNGLSGFTKRTESEYDPFGAAHSSTSISSTLGMAVAKKLSNDKNDVVAVIGDGAMSAGMAYEAMNNAGALKSKLIVILNDNDMSIAKPVGAMSKYLSKLLSGKLYFSFRETIKMIISSFSKRFSKKAGKAEDILRGIVQGGTLFSELGFYYIGPVDGHDIDHLVQILENVKYLSVNIININMARQDITTLKGYFETGDVPSSEQFHNLIDSTYNSTSGIQTLSSGYTGLSVFSLSANEFYINDSMGSTQDLELSTPTGTATLTITNGIITNITTS